MKNYANDLVKPIVTLVIGVQTLAQTSSEKDNDLTSMVARFDDPITRVDELKVVN
jgi:hypothetical protein